MISPDEAQGSDGNVIACEVEERLFHGNSIRLRCRLSSGETFLCDQQLAAATALGSVPDSGQTIHLAADPDSIALFTRDDRT